MTTTKLTQGLIASAALCLCVTPIVGHAATRAGTGIANTATLSWNDGSPQTVSSNTVTLTIAELLDVTIAAEQASVAVTRADTVATGFIVTNTGNGAEDYALTVTSDKPGVAVTRVAIDSDNDGAYDPAKDRMLTAGAALSLTAGQAVRIFVLIDGGQVTATTRISASVAATTGTGTPGTIFAGGGEGGSDAVVGSSGAAATAVTALTPPTGLPTLVKSQSVFAPDGSARAVRGAIITYRIVANFPTATRGVTVDDPIPAGTDYVAGSLLLDDRAVTDARDADAGTVDSAAIHAALGDVAASGTRTVQFSVKIQ